MPRKTLKEKLADAKEIIAQQRAETELLKDAHEKAMKNMQRSIAVLQDVNRSLTARVAHYERELAARRSVDRVVIRIRSADIAGCLVEYSDAQIRRAYDEFIQDDEHAAGDDSDEQFIKWATRAPLDRGGV